MAKGNYTIPGNGQGINARMGTRTLREELESLQTPLDPRCIEFLEYLLNVDPDQRPTATEALQHPWL